VVAGPLQAPRVLLSLASYKLRPGFKPSGHPEPPWHPRRGGAESGCIIPWSRLVGGGHAPDPGRGQSLLFVVVKSRPWPGAVVSI